MEQKKFVFAERLIDINIKIFLGNIKSITQDTGPGPKILDPTGSGGKPKELIDQVKYEP